MADIVYDGAVLPDAYIGVPYNVKVPTHGAATVITASSITVGALPAGLTLVQTAGAFDEVTGTPSSAQEPGLFSFTVSLTDSAGAVTKAMTLNLYDASQIPDKDTTTPANEGGLTEKVVELGEWPIVQ